MVDFEVKPKSLFSKENLFIQGTCTSEKSSTILSLGHTRKPNLELLQKAKLPISLLELSPDLITFDCDSRLST